MDLNRLAKLVGMISLLRPGANDVWTEAHEELYLTRLRNIPADDLPILTDLIIDICSWRPSVAEILELHRKMTAPQDPISLVDTLIQLRELTMKPHSWPVLNEPEYITLDIADWEAGRIRGESRGWVEKERRDHDGRPLVSITRPRTCQWFCCPPEFFDLPLPVQRTVLAMGGWREFCEEFKFSDHGDRAQFRDMLSAACETAGDEALENARERRKQLAGSKPLAIEAPAEDAVQ